MSSNRKQSGGPRAVPPKTVAAPKPALPKPVAQQTQTPPKPAPAAAPPPPSKPPNAPPAPPPPPVVNRTEPVKVEYTLFVAAGEEPEGKGKAHATHHRYKAEGYPTLYIGGGAAPNKILVIGHGLTPSTRKTGGVKKAQSDVQKARADVKALREMLLKSGVSEEEIDKKLQEAASS